MTDREILKLDVVRAPVPVFLAFRDEATGFEGRTDEEERIAFVSLGLAETHVTILSPEARRHAHWTAVFGWSSLFDISILHDGNRLRLETPSQIGRALMSKLTVCGQWVDTRAYRQAAQSHIRERLGCVMDRTIGSGMDLEQVILSGPRWVHPLLEACTDLRPHIRKDIEDA